MKSNEKLIGLLNDLIRINNDRYEGYSSLLSRKVILDKDVWMLVYNLASQSRVNASNLIAEVIKLRTATATGASVSCGIYIQTLGLKNYIPAGDRQAILESCRHREEVVQKAYYDSLSLGLEMPDSIAALITDQKREMKISSGLLKANQLEPVGHAA